jgi:serine/threonine-protein kinase
MSHADTDRNLLFGVLALQADLLDTESFAEACAAWASRKDMPLADLLIERGWLTQADKQDIERLLERKLKKHSGDAHASLFAAAGAEACHALLTLGDADVQRSLAGLPTKNGPAQPETVAYQPRTRSRFVLTQLHAQGGIGQVWLAHDADLGRDVALKELRPERANDPAMAARFLEEAQITGQLEHPGIVPVYELVKASEGKPPFYTMRFVRGRTLSEAIKSYHQKRAAGKASSLDLRELLTAFLAICNAVAYAHARGIVHRDLKGGNVVLGDFGEVMVLDWGLAKARNQAEGSILPVMVEAGAERGETMYGQVLGTPAYMAPEQAEGRLQQVGPRSDVYSLGAILYEILTGTPPFAGDDTQDILRQVIHEAPARPRARLASTPAALEAVCLKALSKRPEQRYGSVTTLADEVRHWQADEPVSAYRDPVPTRLTRWGRRHRSLAAAVAALMVATVAGLTLGTYVLGQANRQIEREREEARRQRDLAQANFHTARLAVDDYFTKVSQNKLMQSPLPGLQPLRKELLQLALTYYQAFLAEHRDDPELRRDLGTAYLQAASIVAEIESVPKAVEMDEQGLSVLSQLNQTGADEVDTQQRIGNGRIQLADHLARIGRDREASANLDKGVALCKQVADDHPEDNEAAYNLCLAFNTAGAFYSSRLRSTEALGAYEKAARILEGLNEQSQQSERLRTLSLIYVNIAIVYVHNIGPSIKAIPVLDKALAIQKQFADKGLGDPENQRILSLIYYNLGLAWANNGRPADAARYFTDMVTLSEKIVRENPTVASYQAALAEHYRIVGRFHRRWGRQKEALKALQAAVEIMDKLVSEHKSNTEYQKTLGLALNSLGILYKETGHPLEAGQTLERSGAVLGRLVRANPGNNLFLNFESIVHMNIGSVHRQEGRVLEAIKEFEKSWELMSQIRMENQKDYYTGDDDAQIFVSLAEAYLTVHKVPEARKLLAQAQEQLDKSHLHRAYYWWRRAGLHAQLARLIGFGQPSLTPDQTKQRKEQLDLAMSAIRRALELGFDELDELKTEHVLDPLRDRTDFQKLVSEHDKKR